MFTLEDKVYLGFCTAGWYLIDDVVHKNGNQKSWKNMEVKVKYTSGIYTAIKPRLSRFLVQNVTVPLFL